LHKEWKPGAAAISEELEGIGWVSTERAQRKDNSTVVQPRLHYCMHIVEATTVSLLVNSPNKVWISNYSFLGH